MTNAGIGQALKNAVRSHVTAELRGGDRWRHPQKPAFKWPTERADCLADDLSYSRIRHVPKDQPIATRSPQPARGTAGRTASAPMPLSTTARIYLGVVIASGFAALAWSILVVVSSPPASYLWLALLALTCFSSTFSISLQKVGTSISVSETFVFLAALLYGPAVATVIIALDGLAISVWRRYRRRQILFNIAGPALSIFVAAQVFRIIAGHRMGSIPEHDVLDGLVPFAGFTLAYFLASSGLMSAIAALQRRTTVWSVWRPHFGVVLLSYCGSASVAALLVYNSRDFSLSTITIVLPLLVISYFTFKTSLQRVEDVTRHLDEVNRLYLSTVETLAIAVDATDQVTHGHIRRVQALALGLARELGVTDENEIKALRAAALLHDVGKLAVPEHILNKPGRLSPAEVEKVKRHAAIGADILSAIGFPYPVVPIVRHHHEQWNGSGYPDGLREADIPLGARILAVVDCYDALISDRPYRRALSSERAVEMLLEERGKAYDPHIVDTFARVYREIAPAEHETGARGETLREITAMAQPAAAPAARPRSAPVPMFAPAALPLADVLLAGTPRAALATLLNDVAESLLRLTPASLCVLYAVDDNGSALVPICALGELADLVGDHQIPVAERLSGWVAANQRTICNSDGALDFVNRPDLSGLVRRCLSVPLASGGTLEGVVSLYAGDASEFAEAHRVAVESAARTLAHLLRGVRAIGDVERLASPGALAALPAFEPGKAAADVGENRRAVAALSLRLARTTAWASRHAVLAKGAARLRRALRESDFVYRDGEMSLVALLPGADLRVAHQAAARVQEDLGPGLFSVGAAAMPADGLDIQAIVGLSRRRASDASPPTGGEWRRARQPALFDDTRPGSKRDVA